MPNFTVSHFYVKTIVLVYVNLTLLYLVLITIRSVKLKEWKSASIQRLSCVLLSFIVLKWTKHNMNTKTINFLMFRGLFKYLFGIRVLLNFLKLNEYKGRWLKLLLWSRRVDVRKTIFNAIGLPLDDKSMMTINAFFKWMGS